MTKKTIYFLLKNVNINTCNFEEFHNCSRNINLLPILDMYILNFCTLVL